jgi:hypothetical protein
LDWVGLTGLIGFTQPMYTPVSNSGKIYNSNGVYDMCFLDRLLRGDGDGSNFCTAR